MLAYLLSRLTAAQGFDTYVDGIRTNQADAILRDAAKKARATKGNRTTIHIHRYYGKDPQEGSSSVWVELPVQLRENSLELEPGKSITIKQPAHYPQWDSRSVEVTRPKATWMAVLGTIEEIRAPRRRS